jgi:hypothetical protein
MCAKVKMLTVNDLFGYCTLVLKKHKYSKCIHYFPFEDNESITAIELPVAPAKRMKYGLTGNSHQYGKVFNSVIYVITQPGSLLPLAESSGLLFFIPLTVKGVLGYYSDKVLKRPHIAAYNTPVSCAFFSTKDYLLCSSVGLIKYLIRQGIHQPSICGFERSSNPYGFQFKKTYRRPYHG